ncbi:TetR/AcrR family transcriptional regulator|nr:TetR/AcrR family transcriptional regulator [Dendrosporobacter quercicolus]NSL49340.1 TetR/AcrR family transcriptional regulator [Dendrosporobacter quercicolus DSM 1736]
MAQTVLNQQGLTNLTMNTLATRLSISKRTLYQNFNSLEELISTVIDSQLAKIARLEKTVSPKSNSIVLEQIRQLLLLYCRILQPLHQMSLEDVKRYYPNLWKKTDEFRQVKWQRIVDLLHKEISRGYIRPINPDILELMIRKSLQELLRAPPLPKGMNFFDACDQLIDILLTGIIKRTPLH